MRAAVVTFPGSNCDRDLAVALEQQLDRPVARVWHGDSELPDVDLVGVPGGFSFGDYLRCGAMSARSPIMDAVRRHAARGGFVLGICNGFQILTEAGMLPGALIRNAGLKFVCREVELEIANANSPFTRAYALQRRISLPVAHHDGNFVLSETDIERLEGDGRVVFRYAEDVNGSRGRIAGVLNERGNVLGMMPHPERACDPRLGGTDGALLFQSLLAAA